MLRPLGLILSAALALAAGDARQSLVTPLPWLAKHMKDPDLVLLHVGEEEEYKASHLPGARFVTLNQFAAPRDRSNPKPGELSLELPTSEQLREALQGLGISDSSKIVIYYGKDWYSPSTRILLTLTHAGLGDRTTLLDGGMRGWVAAGHGTTAALPPPAKPGKLAPLKTVPVTVDLAFVQTLHESPDVVLIDARDQVFYDGLQPGGKPPTPGHIPGAKSLPFGSVFNDETGFLLPATELEALFAKAGVKPGATVVGYCHIGQQATAMLFAARTLGHPVKLYDGSFEEWSQKGLPVVNPAKK